MKAMILAAGRGKRLRPLTDHTPKPLLKVGAYSLIEHTLHALVKAGIRDIVINIAYLGESIKNGLGDGARYGARIIYSDEGEQALETAGGIRQALPLLGEDPFLVVNGDIASDYPYQRLTGLSDTAAHLILVPNPPHHPAGDFALEQDRLTRAEQQRYTYSGIGLYHPRFFRHCPPGVQALAPLLYEAIAQGRISGEIYRGFWMDIGTPERLAELRAKFDGAGCAS